MEGMQLNVTYEKSKVLQALRYHFIQRTEVRVLMILVNVFAIVAAALFYWKIIRPEPFLLGSLIWLGMMAAFWYIMPRSIYARSAIFKDNFVMHFTEVEVWLENERGRATWPWASFNRFFESPHFFHLYFNPRSFFLLPKEGISQEQLHEMRALLRKKIGD
ncbi:MAG: YcxB family protein [Bacteroidota bacterium]|jgi:hypothetical protein